MEASHSAVVVFAVVLLLASIDRHHQCVAQRQGDLRLVDGGSHFRGRLEIFGRGSWGTVCDDHWDHADEKVACRQLGLLPRQPSSYRLQRFGTASGAIHLDDVRCAGSENRLLDCQSLQLYNHDCNHGEDVGVTCQGLKSMELRQFYAPGCEALQADLPMIVRNATWNGAQYTSTYSCAPGYLLHGDRERHCRSSCSSERCNATDVAWFWSGREAVCLPRQCSVLCPPRYGRMAFSNRQEGRFEFNSTVEFTCRPGYMLQGSVTRTCQPDGTWSGSMATCQEMNCTNVSFPHHGWSISRYNGNTQVSGCIDGYYSEPQTQVRVCAEDKNWTGNTLMCTELMCETLPSRSPLRTTYTNQTRRHSIATHVCPLGFDMVGGGTSRQECRVNCTYDVVDGRLMPMCRQRHVFWTGTTPTCQAGPCSNVFPPRHGSLISYELGNVTYNTTEIGFRGVRGMKVTFGCDPTYKLSSEGMRTRTCDVPWSGVAPLCVDVCTGVVCTEDRKCQPHPSLRNSHQCVCKEERDCPVRHAPVCASNARSYRHACHALVDACRTAVNISIVGQGYCTSVKCSMDSALNRTVGQCKASPQAIYNHSSSTCQPVQDGTCLRGGNVFSAMQDCIDTCMEQDPCEQSLDPGNCTAYHDRYYYHKNGGTSGCYAFRYGGCYGNLNNFPTREACEGCTRRCPALCGPDNGRLHGRRRFVGSIARFSCAQGYRLTGDRERVCNSSLRWTGTHPTCKLDCVPRLCEVTTAYTCPANNNTSIATSCGRYRLVDFAFWAYINASMSVCEDSMFVIKLQVFGEFFRSQNCSFLTNSLDSVKVHVNFKNGCPCPFPMQSSRYIVTGTCAPNTNQLFLTQRSALVATSDDKRSDENFSLAQYHCSSQ
ncbi:sushi, von Willebrand factor type A, EGF and pentraxin domain-containing protein 1-like [Sycon ciliatum]|uniref:sushi, von Willebrand factor type A, EGF and pentraxin domain-containing protein 1-like n=1 Tax=Sycon ciliatum TaxID=27933 RepID=UPI0031F63DCC